MCVCQRVYNVDQKIQYVSFCIYLAVIFRLKKIAPAWQYEHMPDENVYRAAKRDRFADISL